jgi:hypothetical protein
VTVAASAVGAVTRSIELLVLTVKEGSHRLIGLDDDVRALAAVTTVRAALGYIGLASKADAASATLPGDYRYACLINEFQGIALWIDEAKNHLKHAG